MFPNEIKLYIQNLKYNIDTQGRSEDKVYFFEEKYVLKVSKNGEILKREKDVVDFLSLNNIAGSKSICYIEEDGKSYYLRTFIKGFNLTCDKVLNNPLKLIDILKDVVDILKSLDNKNCIFKSLDNIGSEFVHGDLCLPNILVDDNYNFVGFIDLGNAGLGDRWYDYAWLLWSLEYNLKTKEYNEILLKKLNIEFNLEKYEKYIPKEYRI